MDAQDRLKKVEGLEAIKKKALEMASQGQDDLSVRTFIDDSKKELAFEVPDEDAFFKAAKVVNKYKKSKKK
tara:strand:- start:486 stop:698 length:213 start_codon:yes stop_codon:yes gene_type:complete